MSRRALAVLVLLAFASLAPFSLARADGEAGVVIQVGDAVQTYCVPFKGDSIAGSDLLTAAGLTYEQVGGSTRSVCAIGDTGCHDAGDFASCFCQCQGVDCVYWAFFTEKYREDWVYSSLAFNLLRAKDGDIQGWKWGKGNPNSAPAPQPATFEGICGHPPNGGVALPATPTATATATPVPPTPLPTTAATTPASAAPSVTPTPLPSAAPSTTDTTPPATPAATETVATIPATGVPTRTAALPTTPSASLKPPATGGEASGGGANAGLIAFGVVAAALVLATGAAVAWRQRHGA